MTTAAAVLGAVSSAAGLGAGVSGAVLGADASIKTVEECVSEVALEGSFGVSVSDICRELYSRCVPTEMGDAIFSI